MKFNHNLKKLLKDTHVSLYWMGFLMADGHFSNINRLVIALANKDVEHLKKFAKYIKYPKIRKRNKTNSYALSVLDTIVVRDLKNKYNINNKKSYNPPSLKINDNKFISFLIGFIDGDGCIRNQTNRNDCVLTIKLHKNWKKTLKVWSDLIYEKFLGKKHNSLIRTKSTVSLTKDNKYCYVNIANSEILWNLKQYCVKNKLPVLKRKWNKIEKPTFKYKKSQILKENIIYLHKKGEAIKNISKKVKVTQSYISMVINGKR